LSTKKHKPRELKDTGFKLELPLFEYGQVEELAAILGKDRTEITKPLKDASAFIWRFFRYVDRYQPTPEERTAVLKKSAETARSLHAIMEDLDSDTRRYLLKEYGDDVTALSADIQGLQRLRQNLEAAYHYNRSGRGRPRHTYEKAAAEKLVGACEIITGVSFSNSRPHRAFVMTALRILGIEQKKAAGALAAVCDARSISTGEKITPEIRSFSLEGRSAKTLNC
jgi:hypothetical protein